MKQEELKERIKEAINEFENVNNYFTKSDSLLDSYTNVVIQNARNEVFHVKALMLLNQIHNEL